MEKIGDVCEKRGEVDFEWQIKDFLQLTNTCYKSPEFSVFGISWVISIYPNGNTFHGSVGSVSLNLIPKSVTTPTTVTSCLYFQTVDGKADTEAKYTSTDIFTEKGTTGWGHKFIPRSKLIERKDELLPLEVLTVVCTLKKNGTSDETGVFKLQQHFKEILENGNLADVILKADGQEYNCHKCVLSRSPVFLAMLTHELKEKNTGVVNIEDIDSNILFAFLKYLYTGSGDIVTSDNAAKLYAVADKYQVDELKKGCLDYMLLNITVDNFCDILSLSLVHSDTAFKNACSQFYIENAEAIVSTSRWLTFLQENPAAGNELFLKQLQKRKKIKLVF